jgi:hypothetical protein
MKVNWLEYLGEVPDLGLRAICAQEALGSMRENGVILYFLTAPPARLPIGPDLGAAHQLLLL